MFIIDNTIIYAVNLSDSTAKKYIAKADFFYGLQDPQYDSCYYHAKKAKPFFLQSCNWEKWYESNWLIVLSLAKQQKLLQAFEELREALDTSLSANMDSRTIGKLYNLFGYLYFTDGQFDKAFHAYLLSLQWIEKSRDLKGVESIYNNIGWISIVRGENEQALNYLKQALSIYLKKESHYMSGGVSYNIGAAFTATGNLDSALVYYNKALDFYGYQDVLSYLRISETQLAKQNIDEAKKWAYKAIEVAEVEEDSSSIVFGYYQIGQTFSEEGRLQLAMKNYEVAKKYSLEVYGFHHRETAKILVSIGDLYQKQEKSHLAYEQYEQALEALLPPNFCLVENQPFIHFFQTNAIQPDTWVTIALERMGDALTAQKNSQSDLTQLKKILHHYEDALDILSNIRTAYIDQSDKLFWGSDLKTIYEKAIYTAHQLSQNSPSHTSQAFSLIERSKAAVLLESIQEQEALQFTEIPDSLSQHLATLKNTIASLAYQKSHSTGKTYQNLQDSIFNTKRALERTLKKTAETYPNYKDYQQDLEPILLAEVQQDLVAPNALLLEFFMGEEKGYVASVRKGRSRIIEIADMGLVQLHIEALHRSLSDKKAVVETPQQAYRQFAESASWLYENLLAESLQGFEGEELVVIPDGLLGYVPFEVLLTAMPDTTKRQYKQLPYLLKKYRVSYAYSATLLKKSQEKKLASKEFSITAFAPFAVGENALAERGIADSILQNLPALIHSKFELDVLSQMFEGHFYYGSDANESAVKQACSKASILHFSTHTLIDDADPMYSVMLFANTEEQDNEGRLYAYELYNRKIDAEMAVLSACETGYGKLSRGEGILSLSRAFVHSGCPSTVMSLWQIDDAASAKVMLHFYQHLQNGSTKDEALRQAKIDYLQETESAYAHPYYWAALVSQGNQRPLDFGWTYTGLLGWSVLGGLVLVCFSGGLFLKVSQYNKNQISGDLIFTQKIDN
ncbi:MAG: CHAT domain-containing protein [Chitinophagales bacterium]